MGSPLWWTSFPEPGPGGGVSPDHKTLVAAVQHVKYEDVLVNAGPFTVYAPTDAAFAMLPEGTLDDLLRPENKATLENILAPCGHRRIFKPEAIRDGMSVAWPMGTTSGSRWQMTARS